MNGDGYDDFVSGYDAAFVYFGSASGPPTTPSITLTPPGASPGIYGYSPLAIGDVNGDGFADVAIGNANDTQFTGRAYLYLGNQNGLAPMPSLTLSGLDGPGGDFGQ